MLKDSDRLYIYHREAGGEDKGASRERLLRGLDGFEVRVTAARIGGKRRRQIAPVSALRDAVRRYADTCTATCKVVV